MNDERALALLTRIEENQRKAMEIAQQHLALTQAQLDRSSKSIQESLQLQRVAVQRQSLLTKFVLPVVVALILLLAWLLFKWRIF